MPHLSEASWSLVLCGAAAGAMEALVSQAGDSRLLSCCCFLSGCRPPGSGDQRAAEEARPQPATAVWKDIHRPYADGGVDQEHRLEPAKDPALPEPHAAPGMFGPALLSAGGTRGACRPPSAVRLPDCTSLALACFVLCGSVIFSRDHLCSGT